MQNKGPDSEWQKELVNFDNFFPSEEAKYDFMFRMGLLESDETMYIHGDAGTEKEGLITDIASLDSVSKESLESICKAAATIGDQMVVLFKSLELPLQAIVEATSLAFDIVADSYIEFCKCLDDAGITVERLARSLEELSDICDEFAYDDSDNVQNYGMSRIKKVERIKSYNYKPVAKKNMPYQRRRF